MYPSFTPRFPSESPSKAKHWDNAARNAVKNKERTGSPSGSRDDESDRVNKSSRRSKRERERTISEGKPALRFRLRPHALFSRQDRQTPMLSSLVSLGITGLLELGVGYLAVVGMQSRPAAYFTRFNFFLPFLRPLYLPSQEHPCPSPLHNAAGYIEYFAAVK